jgi:hypothetical protein
VPLMCRILTSSLVSQDWLLKVSQVCYIVVAATTQWLRSSTTPAAKRTSPSTPATAEDAWVLPDRFQQASQTHHCTWLVALDSTWLHLIALDSTWLPLVALDST